MECLYSGSFRAQLVLIGLREEILKITQICTHPYSVVIFDEFEKAHPKEVYFKPPGMDAAREFLGRLVAELNERLEAGDGRIQFCEGLWI